ncbi:DNA-processing protein DprA [Herbiconiux sp. KACC 21604]|uniref:DNA-processing protein DprA n=1 Tax=unclassified Herbiconiux TaxID=2618217 RepID=UPI0014920F1A|nr:DNA-processing protein DprA [Herbiconiux sp. SALV-R1]QJU52863.1 DNA-protecting protein DprA [Herbiconiux sp. SALV-R1]WPO87780.1 DNA-processing protein DprA [Herbiconiux sp. KACC 21604]
MSADAAPRLHQLDATLVRRLVEGVRGGAVDEDEAGLCFGTAAWGTLTEPGDAVAGAVTQAVGAARALALLIDRQPAERWHAELPAGMGDELAVGDLASGIERWAPRLSSSTVVSAFQSSARFGARLVLPDDPWWPSGLLDLGVHAPLALWVRGHPEHLVTAGGSIAVVGSRDATSYGEHMAAEITSGLVDRGIVVASGAAYGIDGMAHRAVLAAGGPTVAFLAGGVDRLYPAAHHDLLLRVVETGALVSELPCGSSPTKWRFLQRNRLIAASTLATVVVEAGFRSGSLNTAGHAAALGRPIGAVPGPATSATSAGCHRLLREYDATCVTSAEEVAELAGLAPGKSASRDGAARRDALQTASGAGAHGPDGTRLLDALSRRTARGVTELARLTGLAPRSITAALGVLLLEGSARETTSGWLRA